VGLGGSANVTPRGSVTEGGTSPRNSQSVNPQNKTRTHRIQQREREKKRTSREEEKNAGANTFSTIIQVALFRIDVKCLPRKNRFLIMCLRREISKHSRAASQSSNVFFLSFFLFFSLSLSLSLSLTHTHTPHTFLSFPGGGAGVLLSI